MHLVVKMTESSSSKKRARHTIILEILKVAEDGVKKTHIMYKVGLSFDQLKRYLTALKKAGFITHQSRTWKTTEKGVHVIEACEICQRLLKETT